MCGSDEDMSSGSLAKYAVDDAPVTRRYQERTSPSGAYGGRMTLATSQAHIPFGVDHYAGHPCLEVGERIYSPQSRTFSGGSVSTLDL
jgi:hypothetical protein